MLSKDLRMRLCANSRASHATLGGVMPAMYLVFARRQSVGRGFRVAKQTKKEGADGLEAVHSNGEKEDKLWSAPSLGVVETEKPQFAHTFALWLPRVRLGHSKQATPSTRNASRWGATYRPD
ncbi:hypothetical protein EMIHUDRAFT_194377 [Emiliania huxleyi CCMP1516]|uniref:Uncharacterized protein n=2 Tax=Emiliania huxleyi TaxID=2903 RepID=A0A0D3L1E5_EMIH1|nr:hypothetical protein EMIHUDRAFT_194377 [Emiliania huxleyi CCMP1516]EOD41830.1 hypothetical protein EMIHUDRAFT_194377 [Emiliania huxleyi CCMP1516]|eukprot:XP_005794259.1 hypothetical protein EMIHUDRAFT_194377 [Emiliania huxleyi CCMP1516]